MTISLVQAILFYVSAFVLSFVSFWTYFKGRDLKKRGASLSPILWTFLVYGLFIIIFPIFLILKKIKWEKEITESSVSKKISQGQRILVIIIFTGVYILTMFILSLITTT